MDKRQRDQLETFLKEMLGRHFRAKREELNITQDKAAERIGCSAKHYGRIERGEKLPNAFTLSLIQIRLGISSDEYLPELEEALMKLEE